MTSTIDPLLLSCNTASSPMPAARPSDAGATVDYGKISSEYDRRYQLYDYPGIRAAILACIEGAKRPRVLEVGCGTGKWLRLLASAGCDIAGVDPSREMLHRVSTEVKADLRTGLAEALPWHDAMFDLVLYVNAFHHFAAPETALRETFRVLRPGGTLLSIGLDPHEHNSRWYIYDFFPATLTLDQARFPSCTQRRQMLQAAGFTNVSVYVAEHLRFSQSLDDALRDGVIKQSFTSQLLVLSLKDYREGMRQIRYAASEDQAFRLEVDLMLYATTARKPP
jgi:ubiquinone/menaquinone biosynthesis C-methylase UbiE